MLSARRPLKLSDLEALAARFAVELQPSLLYASVDSLVQEVIGHRLFTMMRVHEARMHIHVRQAGGRTVCA